MKLAVLVLILLFASQCIGHEEGTKDGQKEVFEEGQKEEPKEGQEEGQVADTDGEEIQIEMPENMKPVDQKEHEEFLKKSYVEIDVNKDGFVEADELKPFIARGFRLSLIMIDPEKVFDTWDSSKDKYVQRDELCQLRFKKTRQEIEDDMEKLTPLEKIYYTYDMTKFNLADKNKDDKLSKNEVFYFLNTPFYLPKFEVDGIWMLLDLDKDGKVPFEEFRKRTFGKHPDPKMDNEKRDREIFDGNDLNKDGFFEYKEVWDMIIPDPQREAQKNTDTMFKEFDEDKDGKLSKDEYMKSGFYMGALDRPEVKEPQLEEDDVEGPPAAPESEIDYELYESKPKDEL